MELSIHLMNGGATRCRIQFSSRPWRWRWSENVTPAR